MTEERNQLTVRRLAWTLSPAPWKWPFWIVLTVTLVLFLADRQLVQSLSNAVGQHREKQTIRQAGMQLQQDRRELAELQSQALRQQQIALQVQQLNLQLQAAGQQKLVLDQLTQVDQQLRQVQQERKAKEEELTKRVGALQSELGQYSRNSEVGRLQQDVESLRLELRQMQSQTPTGSPTPKIP